MVPAPAITGKASGTMLYTFGSWLRPGALVSSLNSRMPKVISKAMKNSTKEPATAKEFTSMPTTLRIDSPR